MKSFPSLHGVVFGDPLGDRVILWTHVNNLNLLQINLSISGLAKGVYFLKVFSGAEEFYSAKFAVAE